jgi:exosortase
MIPMKTHLLFLPLVLALFAMAYHSTLVWMYLRFIGSDSYYSHGFLIPLVSAFLVWQKRTELKNMSAESSLWGLAFVLFAALLHIFGTILYIFSISGVSIFFLILGGTLFLFGKKIVRAVLFPLLFLLFMFPAPEAFIGAVSFPMKMLVAQVGVWIVGLMGIPVFREGFIITIPGGSLLVGNPCSGLRSLIAFLALGAVFAFLTDIPLTRKGVLFLLAVPVALLSNMLRVPILILISNYWGFSVAEPGSFLHEASGVFVFILGFGLLLLAARMLAWRR